LLAWAEIEFNAVHLHWEFLV